MRHFHLWILFVIISLIFLAGCGPDANRITQTVASQVAADVAATGTAQPLATPYPTQTPYDTATPYATYTPLATAVPPDTATPYPTYTPYPTVTIEPTATVVVVNTPLPATTRAAAAPAATVPPAADQRAQLLTAVENALHDIDVALASLWSVSFVGFPASARQNPTDCPTLIAAYDRLSNAPTLNTTAADPDVQNAYPLYRAAIDSALIALEPRTSECRQLVAAGNAGTVMDQSKYNVIDGTLSQSKNWLNQALNDFLRE